MAERLAGRQHDGLRLDQSPAERLAAVEAVGHLVEHGLRWSDPDCGVNAFVEVPDGFDGGEAFCRRLVAEESIVLAPGEAFDHPGWFRLGYGLPREELEAGLERVGAFLERHA